jgi:hypothetical protein
MIVLGLAWYIQARDGNIHLIGLLGSSSVNTNILGHRSMLQLFGDTKNTLQILITNIIHYERLKHI